MTRRLYSDDLNLIGYGFLRTWQQLDRIEALLQNLTALETHEMATLDEIQADVAANTDATNSAIALLTALHDQLTAAIASGDPAALQAVADGIAANTASLAAAVTANTPAAP